MHIEIAAILTVASKLDLLEELLDKRLSRAATDTVSPTLPLLEKVYRLGEYKRLAANLAVMEHRIRCALGDEQTDAVVRAAPGVCGADLRGRKLRAALETASRTLGRLGVLPVDMESYKRLPLFRAECAKIERLQKACLRQRSRVCKRAPRAFISRANAAAFACCRDGRTAQA